MDAGREAGCRDVVLRWLAPMHLHNADAHAAWAASEWVAWAGGPCDRARGGCVNTPRTVVASVGVVLGSGVVEPVDLELRGQRFAVGEPRPHAAQLVDHHRDVRIRGGAGVRDLR